MGARVRPALAWLRLRGLSHSPPLISTLPAWANPLHRKPAPNPGDGAWCDPQAGSGRVPAGQRSPGVWGGGHNRARAEAGCLTRVGHGHLTILPDTASALGWVPHAGQVCPTSPPGLPAEHGLVHGHQ